MSAAVLRMPRSQPQAYAARMAATAARPAPLTAPALAMYRQTLRTAQHVATLAREAQLAEQSHDLAALGRDLERIREQSAAVVERIYRLVGDASASPLEHVEADRSALIQECADALGLNRGR